MNVKDKPTELSYYGLYLLNYLKESHPDKAEDAGFVAQRAEDATSPHPDISAAFERVEQRKAEADQKAQHRKKR